MRKAIIACALFGVIMFAVGCGASADVPEVEDTPVNSVTEQAVPSQTDVAIEEEKNNIFTESEKASIALTSADLHDGVWDTIITNTENGSNVSPQLSWEPVSGAECYVIYMVDTTAMDWIHWKSDNVTETTLSQGWASEDEYIGPYPPSGTHDYDVYVIALGKPVERVKGSFNASNLKFKENVLALDEAADGSSQNILAYGYITGTYTSGD